MVTIYSKASRVFFSVVEFVEFVELLRGGLNLSRGASKVDAVFFTNPFNSLGRKHLLSGTDSQARKMRHLLFEPTVEGGVTDACGRRKLGFICAFHGP